MANDDGRFIELELALAEADATAQPSEVHGLACALLAIGAEPVVMRLAETALPPDSAGRARAESVLAAVVDDARKALSGIEFAFEPMLLDDEAPLADRIESLTEWSSGFLLGLGHAAGDGPVRERLSQEPLAEMMSDLVQITRAEADGSDANEADTALMEISEYLRVAAQMFFDELAPIRAAAAPSPTDDA